MARPAIGRDHQLTAFDACFAQRNARLLVRQTSHLRVIGQPRDRARRLALGRSAQHQHRTIQPLDEHPGQHGESVGRRCLELGYPPETAIQIAQVLPNYLTEQDIGVIRITDLVAHLRYEASGMSFLDDDESDDDFGDGDDDTLDPWLDDEFIASPILLEGLAAAAEKGNADAHYALALLHAPSDDSYDEPRVGGEYWYQEDT